MSGVGPDVPGGTGRRTDDRLARRAFGPVAIVLGLLSAQPVRAGPEAGANGAGESVEAVLCRLVDGAAREHRLPVAFLTRLIWQESSFRPDVVSRAGAQGIAQFMPGTARERGLADPFDPEQAIPAAASFVAALGRQFGNLGLAAAAYNGGPGRVTRWLAGGGGLPDETRSYVLRITGRSAEDWIGGAAVAAEAVPSDVAASLQSGPVSSGPAQSGPAPSGSDTCLGVTATLRAGGLGRSLLAAGATAPWGVQLAGNFSKAAALAAFERSRVRLAAVLPDVQPMVIGGRLRFRGSRAFYRVRVPAPSRGEAAGLCSRIRGAGGACLVLRS